MNVCFLHSIQEPKTVGGCWLDIKKMRICTNDEDFYNLYH